MRIDPAGVAHRFGTLVGIEPAGFIFTDRNGRQEIFEGIPWFLFDMQPQGFLGRVFPTRFPGLDLPRRIADWNDGQILEALTRRGEDCPGDLIVGDESAQRFFALEETIVGPRSTTLAYDELATRAIAGNPAGSSAGGEQPKFAVALESRDRRRHVLVKFTDGSGSLADLRMRDLLACENIALDVLARSKLELQIPMHRLLHSAHRTFFEVERFDRTEHGRRGVVSLTALDAQFIGDHSTWAAAAMKLRDRKMISDADAMRVLLLESFGRLIGNTDMHYGNLSFFRGDPPDALPLALAPVYDQLPMLYAPVAGEVVLRQLERAAMAPSIEALPIFPEAVRLARRFWSLVAEHARVSTDFREIAANNTLIVATLERAAGVIPASS